MFQNFSEGPYAQMGTPAQSIGFPDVLDFTQAGRLIANTPENHTFLGVDGAFQPITVDLDSVSPHVLVVAGTGGGKSVVARGTLAPAVARGTLGVILDVKQCSHRWAYGAENIGYAMTLPEIGNALVELGREVHRRNQIIRDWHGPIETAPVGPPIMVVFEEINATMTQLKELDRRIPKGSYKAIEALGDVLLLGRAARVRMVGVMQFPDFRILPQAMVAQFNARVMIRYDKTIWTKIAWDAGLPQAAPSHPGRGMVVYGGKARETQLVYLTEQECRALVDNYQKAVQSTSVPMIGR